MKVNPVFFIFPLFAIGGAVFLHGLKAQGKKISLSEEVPRGTPSFPSKKQQQVSSAPAHVISDAYAVSIPRSEDGHFRTTAKINNHSVHFLVDTGATSIALTLQDAKSIGIDTKHLTYNIPVQTASGITYAAPAHINSISIGYITEYNIRTVVVKQGLRVSLLGMSFLQRMNKIETSKYVMILHR